MLVINMDMIEHVAPYAGLLAPVWPGLKKGCNEDQLWKLLVQLWLCISPESL